MNKEELMQQIATATDYIKSKIDFTPEVAVILGSGLGPLANEVELPVTIPYSDIPGFKASTVVGHAGTLIAGTIKGRKVLVMNGRFHFYEGHPMETVTLPIRVFAAMGITKLIVTNAAGGIGDEQIPGSIMLITDHFSFFCKSPLLGPNLDEFGPRFKDMTEVYTHSLRELARKVAAENNISLTEGVYNYVTGPQYETPAEIRALKLLGANATGMSTVPEAIVARHCGMDVLGFSLITNKAAGLGSSELSHSEVTEIAHKAERNMVTLVSNVIKSI